MSTITYAVRDSATMLRRDLRHALRFPLMSLSGLIVPVLSCSSSPGSSATPWARASAPLSPPAAATSTTSSPASS
jgi:hypothetical protein